jgi:hypothetical protein
MVGDGYTRRIVTLATHENRQEGDRGGKELKPGQHNGSHEFSRTYRDHLLTIRRLRGANR